jgi:sugar phosphate isomerase/epimerase
MRIGCAAFNLAKHYAPAIDKDITTVAELGFDGIELIVSSLRYLDEHYTRPTVEKTERLIRTAGLALSELDVGASMIDGIASFDAERKGAALQTFARCAAVARDLGTTIICFVSHWPEGLKAPVPYIPNYLYPGLSGAPEFNPKMRMDYPEGFDWAAAWGNYADSIGRCASIAASLGLSLAIESHTHAFISGTDSYLRLFDAAGSDRLGANLDTAFPLRQREYVPTAIYKLKGKLLHVHARDGDGILNANLPPGLGIVDWGAVVKALADIGYDGFLSFELSGYGDPVPYLKQARDFLASVLRDGAPDRTGTQRQGDAPKGAGG